MRSEHNGGASLAAFLLAVSTITLLFVYPVEGQVGDACVVTAFPGEPEACPALDGQGNPLLCLSNQCETCESAGVTTRGCETTFPGDADQIANCLRDCFGIYPCTSDTDCPADRPTCFDADSCGLECEVSAFPDASGSCPDQVGSYNAGPQFCLIEDGTNICAPCTPFEQNVGITTAADCEKLMNLNQNADVVANCQRECFGFFACATNADCPPSLPFCDIFAAATEGECVATDPSECVVTAFPGETGSCPDQDHVCIRTTTTAPKTVCIPCVVIEQDLGIGTAAECVFLENPPDRQTADVVANCQRSCYNFYTCETNADCPDTLPYCNVPDGDTEGECSTNCVISAFPGEPGSCGDEELCGRGIGLDGIPTGDIICESCTDPTYPIPTLADCEAELTGPPNFQEEDVVENCQRACFDYYVCTTNADCQDVPRPLAQACTSGVCTSICATNADCPADRPLCESGQCLAECGTNADCPADRPLCDAGQCVVSSVPSSPTFSPLDGMGGGSSA